jgi:hypothetical protein
VSLSDELIVASTDETASNDFHFDFVNRCNRKFGRILRQFSDEFTNDGEQKFAAESTALAGGERETTKGFLWIRELGEFLEF